MNDAEEGPAERGRYAVYVTDNGTVIARATGLCESCSTCGCGQQQENIDLGPDKLMDTVERFGMEIPAPMKAMARGMLKMMAARNGG